MYHTNACSLKIVSNYMIFSLSYWTLFVVQMVSHMDRRCFGSFNPIPLISSNLSVLSTPTMLLCVGPPLGDTG
jgi:hypothetical protein